MKKPYYITTPIYYPNSVPHIGSVYTTVCCDVIARFKRLEGFDVKFITGTDEHGQKVEEAALKAGKTPQTFVDEISENFKRILPTYNIEADDFIRTTEPRHKKGATAFWSALVASDNIYEGNYAGWYSVRDETFYAEAELVDGKAPTGAPVTWVEEPSYFFRLSKWEKPLLEFYEKNPKFIAPESRRNEVISFVKSGLRDLSVSRTTFKWGIPVPNNPDHIMYVWIDALTNYITALGYPDIGSEDYEKFWPASLHVVGKDILRFHAIFWPAFLMAANLPLPKRIFAHGWWTVEGQKMSKSLGNVIDPFDLAERFTADVVRYFLVTGMHFGSDGDFSEKALIQKSNTHLANELGNLAQRTLSMVHKNCDARIPVLSHPFIDEDQSLLIKAQNILSQAQEHMEAEELQKYVSAVWQVIWAANKYIDDQAPWTLRKDNEERMKVVLYTVLETLRYVAIMLQPLIPDAASKLLDLLQVQQDQRAFSHLSSAYAVPQGASISKPTPLFPRIEEDFHAD